MVQSVTYRIRKTCAQLAYVAACALAVLALSEFSAPFALALPSPFAAAQQSPLGDVPANPLSLSSAFSVDALSGSTGSTSSTSTSPSADSSVPANDAAPANSSVPADSSAPANDAAPADSSVPAENAPTNSSTIIKLSHGKQHVPVAVGSTSVDNDPENVINEAIGSDSSFVYETEISALNNQPHLYDKRTVQVTGEVVGDLIKAEDPNYCWLIIQELSTGSDAQISLYVTPLQAQKIDMFGRYGVRGSIIKATGMFQEVDPELEGSQSLRTSELEVLEKGVITKPPFRLELFAPGICAVLLGCVVLYVFYRAHERQR